MAMTSEAYNAWSLLLQVIIGAAVIATFIVYYHQLKAMRAANWGQNLLAIQKLILEEQFRQDRGVLIALGEQQKPLAQWTPEERRVAERVCAAYGLVGLIVSLGLVPVELMDHVRYSMTKCHHAAAALLTEVRSTRAPDLWHHFTDMVEKLTFMAEATSRRTTS